MKLKQMGLLRPEGLNKVNNFKFLASLAMLHDVLTVISKLSKVFQKDNIDIDQMNGMITSTKLTLETFIKERLGR